MLVRTRADGGGVIEDNNKDIIGEIGVITNDCFYIFTNSMVKNSYGCVMSGNGNYEDKAKEKGYSKTWGVLSNNTCDIEILHELPEEKTSMPSILVRNVFKSLKVGMFVKINTKTGWYYGVKSENGDIIGEIGIIEDDRLFIFTNGIDGEYGTHSEIARKAAINKGYKTAWCVKSRSDDAIEILDSLPDEMKPKLKDEPCASIEAYKVKCSWNNAACATSPSECCKRKRRIAETLKQLDQFMVKSGFNLWAYYEEHNCLKTIAKNLHSLLDCEIDCDDDEDCDTCCNDDEE